VKRFPFLLLAGVLAASVAAVAQAALSPGQYRRGSERLAFLRGTANTVPCGVVYTMNSDGSDQQRLVGMRLPVCFPSWSRDGKRVAFDFESGKPGIYTSQADGSDLRRLTAGHNDFYPAWSPDGNRLAFSRKFNLYVMNADGSRLTALTHITAAQGVLVAAPHWSPDGTRIAFAFERRNSDVLVLDLARRRLTVLGTGFSPSWSPDGKKIVFEHNGKLELTSPEGGKVRSFVAGDDPSWSPDGRKIAFYRHLTGLRSAIYVVNIDGSGARRISTGPYDTTPDWLSR